jgi:hypothetical protein
MTVYQNIGGSDAQVGVSRTTLGVAFNMGNDDATVIDTQLYNANSVCTVQLLNDTGPIEDMTINSTLCPAFSGAGGVFIIPPVGKTGTIKLKGIGDTLGVSISTTAPTFLCFPTTPVAFVISNSIATIGHKYKLVWV